MIVFEMSNDYRLILPMLMVVVITTILTDIQGGDRITAYVLPEEEAQIISQFKAKAS